MTNYSKGANFERRVKKRLEKLGYYVIRAAGSHGTFDLVAFKAHRRPLGIQCKYGNEDLSIYGNEFSHLRELAKTLNIRTALAVAKPYGEMRFYDGFTKERFVII